MVMLGPEAARIFRITHVQNVPWILTHGLHCRSSNQRDPNFVPIGMPDLIEKRATRNVPLPPGGVLGDYVPFYFTPRSIMMFNIKTGRNNVIQRPNAEIAILVSSLHRLQELNIRFLFTDGHAYMKESDYFGDLADLNRIDWELLKRRDFKYDAEDPGKLGRYQAEALVHRHLPISALLGIACYDSQTQRRLEAEVSQRGLSTPVKAIPTWYF
jgi:hypothetical protein